MTTPPKNTLETRDKNYKSWQNRTRLVVSGRDPDEQFGFVNMPPYRGSTVVYPTLAALEANTQRYTYGTHATPTTDALASAWSALAGADHTVLVPSGLAAIALALTAVVKHGDHILMTDSVYFPTRRFCNGVLKRMGVETQYYDPMIGAGIQALIRPNTRLIFMEAPGSQSMEMQDIPAIVAVAKQAGVCTILDNTWATPLFFPPHDNGIDICIEAGTKYLSGHSDLLLGMVSTTPQWSEAVEECFTAFGIPPGPEDVFLALRGMRTMELRLKEAERQALAMAHWFCARPEVLKVLHPALPDYDGHDIWKRDFKGSSGLFSVLLKPMPKAALAAMLDGLELFAMGYSWGGFESLVISFNCAKYRTATTWSPPGPALRFSIGLEDVRDLQADLDAGFARAAKVMG